MRISDWSSDVCSSDLVVFGGLLSERECDQLVEAAKPRITRSSTVNLDTGADEVHEARTSEGMFFTRGQTPLCERIEKRIAALLDWPLENGEGMQATGRAACRERVVQYV